MTASELLGDACGEGGCRPQQRLWAIFLLLLLLLLLNDIVGGVRKAVVEYRDSSKPSLFESADAQREQKQQQVPY